MAQGSEAAQNWRESLMIAPPGRIIESMKEADDRLRIITTGEGVFYPGYDHGLLEQREP